MMEVRRDEYGPQAGRCSIAPWQVHLNALKLQNQTVCDAAEKLYADLTAAGVEVLFDDRNERPGVQFADADLLGIPIRLIVGERNLANGDIEVKRRDTGETSTAPVGEVTGLVKQWIADGIAQFQPND
jgi:prolyl-tRNA synthetase